MTIAVGVLASDGVVLAADTEYTWGYLKTSGEKIWTAEANGSAVAVAGAGGSDYVEAVSQELLDNFQAAPEAASAEEIKKRFGTVLSSFHREHVVPFAEFHSQLTTVCLLVAYQRESEAHLWATQFTNIRRRGPYAVIGLGCEYAAALLGQVFRGKLARDIHTALAERIAAYAVFDTKNNVQNCGKKTSMVALQGGRVIETSPSKLQALTSHFETFEDLQTLGLRYALGFPYSDEQKASTNLTGYFSRLREDVMRSEALRFDGKERDLE